MIAIFEQICASLGLSASLAPARAVIALMFAQHPVGDIPRFALLCCEGHSQYWRQRHKS
jgi:hypothetical protein